MATLTVLKFPTSEGAEQALNKLQQLQKQALITITDAALVTWPQGKKRPQTRQVVNTVRIGMIDGAFWGLLFGLLFFMPLMGAAIGVLTGALGGALVDYGIDDDFIRQIRSKVTEGSSALFVLSENTVVDRVSEELKPLHPELIATNLSKGEEAKLREHFETYQEEVGGSRQPAG